MTVAHLLECLLGKAACCIGSTIDATPFNNNVYDDIYNRLENEFSMNRHGNEILYNGFTGDQMSTEIFIGPTYYERLKHMVADKMNYRSTGFKVIKNEEGEYKTLKTAKVMALTRQPGGGRGDNDGAAAKIGEMEKDCILSNGLANFLNESMMYRSDAFDVNIDNNTSFINKGSIKDTEDISRIKVPFSFKTMVQELAGLSIKANLNIENIEEEETYEDDEISDIEDDIE
jgi:DNA-directed RNA polymerase II subunit RPB2